MAAVMVSGREVTEAEMEFESPPWRPEHDDILGMGSRAYDL